LLGPGINKIGSDPQSNIVLDRPGVMPRHCELNVSAHGVMLQVPAGTTVNVNGRDVDGVIALRPGDSVAFDGVLARLASVDAAVPTGYRAPQGDGMPHSANDDPGATTIRPVMPKYVLRGVSGIGFGRSYPVVGTTVIGRAPECELRIDERGISRQHARMVPSADGLNIQDLDSANGCFINGKRVRDGYAVPGDEIGFDTQRFRLVAPGQAEQVHAVPRSVSQHKPFSPWLWLLLAVLSSAAATMLWLLR
ncbi:MAG: FHA domain-containing protein, partial [Pseudomonadota bacterium]|nr:FHA domain-containing protein [Pseudomonadota bacterium]